MDLRQHRAAASPVLTASAPPLATAPVERRVRYAVRDGVGVCLFSLAASGGMASVFLLLARLAG